MKSRIIIADDHPVVLQGLRDMVGDSADLEVVAEASDGVMAEALARTTLAELLLLDIGLPLRRGIAVLERLRRDGIMLPVVFFSMYPHNQYASLVKAAGAQGFVGKDACAAELLQALRMVLAGGSSFLPRSQAKTKAHADGAPFLALSARELQVCRALLAGTSLTSLAGDMQVSTKTLSTYRTRLLSKLGVQSNAELVALAICHGYH